MAVSASMKPKGCRNTKNTKTVVLNSVYHFSIYPEPWRKTRGEKLETLGKMID